MIGEFLTLFFLSIACGAISMTLSKSLFFVPLRGWIKNRNEWVWEGISCPYCMSHWIAFILMLIYFPRPFRQVDSFIYQFPASVTVHLFSLITVIDFGVGWMMMVALASLTARVIYSSYSVMAD